MSGNMPKAHLEPDKVEYIPILHIPQQLYPFWIIISVETRVCNTFCCPHRIDWLHLGKKVRITGKEIMLLDCCFRNMLSSTVIFWAAPLSRNRDLKIQTALPSNSTVTIWEATVALTQSQGLLLLLKHWAGGYGDPAK